MTAVFHKKETHLAFVAVAAACALWGTSFIFGKIALAELSVSHVVLYRFLIGSAVLLPLALRTGILPKKRDLSLFVWAGVLGVPVTLLLQFGGLALTTATHAALLIGTAPPLLAVASFLFFKERLGRRAWWAIGLSSLGVVLMVGLPGTGRHWIGDGLVLLSVVTAVAWILLSKRLMVRYPALVATAYMLAFGTLTLVPIVVVWDGLPPLDLSLHGWYSVLGLGLGCTALAFILWNWGLERVDAGRVGVFLNLEPLVGAVLGMTLLGEALTVGGIAGGGCVLVAAWMITRRSTAMNQTEEVIMIARTWHGAVPSEKADAYHDYLHRTGIPDYQQTPGNRGVYVLRRTEGDVTHFLLLSLWESLDTIRAFAGDDVEQARYYPEDADFLLELEPCVTHYDVLLPEER